MVGPSGGGGITASMTGPPEPHRPVGSPRKPTDTYPFVRNYGYSPAMDLQDLTDISRRRLLALLAG
ncbi:MAG: hypothetical protein ABEH90_02530, partial [Halolamina sp.]